VIHTIVDPAQSQIGAPMAAFHSARTAWTWLLHEYAPKAGLRPEDSLWIRFPARFQTSDENVFWNERVEILREVAGTVKGFKIIPYMLPPPGVKPRIENGQARTLHDHCRGGIAWDSSVLRAPPCKRTIIEPCWMFEAPWNHSFDAVTTEDHYRDKFNPRLGTYAPVRERGKTLFMLFHHAVPRVRWNRDGVAAEIREFAEWVGGVSRELSRPGRRGVVPVIPLDLLADYGIPASEAEWLMRVPEPAAAPPRACPITCSECADDPSGHHFVRGSLGEADPNHPGAPLDTALMLCRHCPEWRLITDEDEVRR